MKKEDSFLSKIGKAFKNIFISLFGFGRHKKQLEEELINKNEEELIENKDLIESEIISPSRQIFRKFIRNRVAIVGLVMFAAVILFVVIGSNTIEFNASYLEPSQRHIEPGFGYTKVPRGLQKEGIKEVDGEYLIGIGTAFTVAISNEDKIYVWGANIDDVKKVPAEVKDRVGDIVQLSVGSRHVVALTNNGELIGWGSNTFHQSQIPVFNPGTDQQQQFKKSVEAYFNPSARTKYPNEVVSKIEEDPIKRVYAGDQFTIVFTENNNVYAWGVVRTKELDNPAKTFNALEVMLRYTEQGGLRWKYSAEDNLAYNLSDRLVLTKEELISELGLVEEDGATLELRYFSDRIQYRNRKTGNEPWENAILKEPETEDDDPEYYGYDFLMQYVDEEVTNAKIVDVHIMFEHVAYELEDNRFIIVGVGGLVKEDYPRILSQTAEERGYRIEKIFASSKNGFYIDENGGIVGWGEISSENRLNTVDDVFEDKKIIDGAGGMYHITLLEDNGTVHIMGFKNTLGHLNMPDDIKPSKKVIANFFNSIAIENDGTIRAWGNKGYLFGTDQVGADVYKRIVAGGSMTLSVAAVAVVVSLIIGLTVGLIAGFYGKWLDNVLMRFGEIISAFPFLPLAMTLSSIVHNASSINERERVFMIMFILGILSWPGLARLVRGQILAEREKDYILAAKALGVKERHIIIRHILPNVVNVVIVNTTLSYAGALLTESGLSFLGFGVMYPQPSWGNMLTGAQSMTTLKNYWWLWIIPAFFIIATALSVNLIGDGLREAMDPKSSER